MPNRKGPRTFLFDRDNCDENYEFDSYVAWDEKDWLQTEFRKEWLYLNEKYNQDYDDIVKWGIFSFYW
jgi:hypothetical protein